MQIQSQTLRGFDEHVEKLTIALSFSTGTVDLMPFFYRFTLATTTALIFGESISTLGDEEEASFAKNFDYAQLVCAYRIRLADAHWAYNPSSFKKSCRIVKGFANRFVEQALKERGKGDESAIGRYKFIYNLYDEYKDPGLVRDQLVNVLLAGRDSTALLMTWTL